MLFSVLGTHGAKLDGFISGLVQVSDIVLPFKVLIALDNQKSIHIAHDCLSPFFGLELSKNLEIKDQVLILDYILKHKSCVK